MKRISIFFVFVFVLFSCNKPEPPVIDTVPNLSLNNLKTISTNIPDDDYSDLTFIDENTGFAVSKSGHIIKTIDAGYNWSQLTIPTSFRLEKIQFTDNQNGFVIGDNENSGYLLKTSDAGKTWNSINLNTMECPSGMFFLNNSVGFITGKGLFIKTIDGGQTWTSLKDASSFMYVDVNFKNKNEGIATSSNGIYYKTTNGGAAWTKVQTSETSFLYEIYYVNSKTLIKNSNGELIDISNNSLVKVPITSKLLFLNSNKSIAIGQYYLNQGFYPYGAITITNDFWKNSLQKSYSPVTEADIFRAISKINDKKIMILGHNANGVSIVVVLNI
ncbi:MAG: hypothetical protein K2X95_07460 [Flavobacteriaceae bacterium]|nr:hypothetical protein [Flavobacteriaceae bacterium]